MSKLAELQVAHNTHGWLKTDNWVPNHTFLLYDLNNDHTYQVTLTAPLVWGFSELGTKGTLTRRNRFGEVSERGRSLTVTRARGYRVEMSTIPMQELNNADKGNIPLWEWAFRQRISANAHNLFGEGTDVYKRHSTVAQWLVGEGLLTQPMRYQKSREWEKRLGPWLVERTGWEMSERYGTARFKFPHPWSGHPQELTQDEALCVAFEMGYISEDDKPILDGEDVWPVELSRHIAGSSAVNAVLDLPLYTMADLPGMSGEAVLELAEAKNNNVDLICDQFINTMVWEA